jgi:pyruvate dehydrogenase (quinone)
VGMPSSTVADLVVARLHGAGVRRVFGYSGDGINTLTGALRRQGQVTFVQARHEENAAFMAAGHAKYTGEVGVVLATQGPGAIHLLNGLYDAKLDSAPVLAVVGQQQRSALGSGYQQEVDLERLFADVAAYVQTVADADAAPMVLDRALRTAAVTRQPCVVILPHDVQKQPAPDPDRHEHGDQVTSTELSAPLMLPDERALTRAMQVLDAGERVAILLGRGAENAVDEVQALAERLGAGVTTSLLGKPGWDESLPYSCGVMGHLGTPASGWLMDSCDTLLILGSNDPWTEFYPAPGQARAVQVDLDGTVIGNRYPVEVGLVGDVTATVEELCRLLQPRPGWAEEVARAVGESRAILGRRVAQQAAPLNPARVVAELSGVLPGDALVSLDVGSVVYWYARHLELPAGVPAHLSSTLASMGCGVPYGLAAKLAAPERPVVVLSGDGAFQMSGIAELVTVSRLWRTWADPRFVVLVLDNGDLAEVTWEQREMEGEPRFAATQDLPAFPYAGYAELLGLRGLLLDDPAAVGDVWRQALDSDRPVVIHARVDADVPLLPPFPAGQEKSATMQEGLQEEGRSGEHALRLLEEQVAHES